MATTLPLAPIKYIEAFERAVEDYTTYCGVLALDIECACEDTSTDGALDDAAYETTIKLVRLYKAMLVYVPHMTKV